MPTTGEDALICIFVNIQQTQLHKVSKYYRTQCSYHLIFCANNKFYRKLPKISPEKHCNLCQYCDKQGALPFWDLFDCVSVGFLCHVMVHFFCTPKPFAIFQMCRAALNCQEVIFIPFIYHFSKQTSGLAF